MDPQTAPPINLLLLFGMANIGAAAVAAAINMIFVITNDKDFRWSLRTQFARACYRFVR